MGWAITSQQIAYTYDDFDTWLDAVRTLSPGPVAANDRWYDVFLCALDPHVACASPSPRGPRGGPPRPG